MEAFFDKAELDAVGETWSPNLHSISTANAHKGEPCDMIITFGNELFEYNVRFVHNGWQVSREVDYDYEEDDIADG